ncbi:MAG: iron-containing alcohol dehydrogenase [Pseudomonadota bacterium]|nr:iron-containing alcohol dehydrogenase [Pseudomonadota bacterium]MDP1902926.1 iron-containing alcohol dehydrogenase [Pseudomonadota bacterium]MDP2353025.1 iron-containing alcohol dehydrogenase [Pseudomonadota bacterium]
MIFPFSVTRLPRIDFGAGRIAGVPDLVASYGSNVLIVTGSRSFVESAAWDDLARALKQRHVHWQRIHVAGEPSPELVDATVSAFRDARFDCVLGIGGGSALDAAKAIAGLLRPGTSVLDHLEGVGPEHPYIDPATPFIAVPTTAGTGSEATKNAVLSIHGTDGFKKSFRDDKLVAEHAVIDPDLLASCPPGVLAANGMDAFTQLLESFVSSKANPFTDALALSGMSAVRDALLPWYEGKGDLAAHRANMAYAALLSGITLAQVGLGSVHGLASPLGAFFPIPHGVVCGTLVAEATRLNLAALRERAPEHDALRRYADVGRLMTARTLTDDEARTALVALLEDWTRRLDLPRLGAYGVTDADLERIVANSRGSSMKTNPIVLTDQEIAGLVRARL